MATRIVAIGWGGQAAEIEDVGDASALVDEGRWRVSLTKWGGPLADATVIQPNQVFRTEDEIKGVFKSMLRLTGATEVELDTPIPVG